MRQRRITDCSNRYGVRCRLVCALLCVVSIGLVAAGCRSEDPAERAAREAAEKQQREQEEEEEKRNFELQPPVVLPVQEGLPLNYVKPGHWSTTAQQMQCNADDFVGFSDTWLVDENGRDIPIGRTRYRLRSTRPVVLSKERPKNIATQFLVPHSDTPVRMVRSLRQRQSGIEVAQREQWPLVRLDPYQYLFVVMAAQPDRYAYLKTLDSVKVPYDGTTEFDDTQDTVHYQVLHPDVSKQIPLADNALSLTTMAYILWDEVDPKLFTPAQQAAVLDWLHWGGQLLISGPDSLDLLADSFLEPYLPARSDGARTITTDDLAELSRQWTIESAQAPRQPLEPARPWSGVRLVIDDEGQAVAGTGELLVERDVGRGRIVVSAMQLTERELINWSPHFQSLFNAGLLRRAPRRYQPGVFGDATLLWDGQEMASRRLDARLTSSLRYFARDVGVETNYQRELVEQNIVGAGGRTIRQDAYSEIPPEAVGGVAAWNSYSATAKAARAALRQAAGVEVPRKSFVVTAVALYLLVLVPLNWLFFQAIGRVELAWIAAPLIAVLGTFVVVHQAQLDIGFVRSHTEVGIMELQPGYSRGHLSRFAALYTSLATTYDLEFENLSTVAAPFPGSETNPRRRGQRRSWATIERHDAVRLSDVQVTSNSTEMVHSEQMIPLDGAIELGTSSRGHRQVHNGSQFKLSDVVIMRRTTHGEGGLEGVWIGELRSGESSSISFLPLPLDGGEIPFAAERQAAAATASGDRLDIDGLLTLACDAENLAPGETRLVGRIDEIIPGESASPAASQISGSMAVVAHLDFAKRVDPVPDVNAAVDVVDESYEDIEPFEF